MFYLQQNKRKIMAQEEDQNWLDQVQTLCKRHINGSRARGDDFLLKNSLERKGFQVEKIQLIKGPNGQFFLASKASEKIFSFNLSKDDQGPTDWVNFDDYETSTLLHALCGETNDIPTEGYPE